MSNNNNSDLAPSDLSHVQTYYQNNITRYGLEAPRTMGYHSAPIDDRLIKNMLPEQVPDKYSVLDVGCGLGQLIPILQNKFPESVITKFSGLDIVEQFISHCCLKYDQNNFENFEFISTNFLEWQAPQQYDLVIAAGVLVTQISDFDNYLTRFIEKMLSDSKHWIGFNVVNQCGPTYTAKHLATIPENRLLEILANFKNVDWQLEKKEVFPGADDIFVRGKK